MPNFHHHKLPGYSTLLAGLTPPDDVGFQSKLLQIWYNNTCTGWVDTGVHMHAESDECFIVLKGRLLVEVEGERFTINAGEFCCFKSGVYHSIIEAHPPVESLMVRAPSIADKVYQERP